LIGPGVQLGKFRLDTGFCVRVRVVCHDFSWV
jgi:hypothetical protein